MVGKDSLTLVPRGLVLLAPGEMTVLERLFAGSANLTGSCTGTFLYWDWYVCMREHTFLKILLKGM